MLKAAMKLMLQRLPTSKGRLRSCFCSLFSAPFNFAF